MPYRRIIARLDIKGPNVIKGIQMEGLRVIGKPADLARRYYEDGADELVFVDTVATLYGRDNIREVVELAANELFIPLTVGGGIRTLSDAKDMLMSGADKVAVNSGAIRNPSMLGEIASVFGNQCVVLSVEAKRIAPGRWEPYIDNGREPTGLDLIEWCTEAVSRGAGEVLLTSVDCDGTKRGFDLELVEAVSTAVSVPVVCSGGAGTTQHVVDLFHGSKVDAVAVGTVLHYGLLSIAEIKNAVLKSGHHVRTGP